MPGSDHRETGDHAQRARVPDDVVVDLVSDRRCRNVLACLAEADEPKPVDDLARDVLARERDVDAGDVELDDVKRVREDLFQEQLPKLTPTGLVTYDSMLGTVALDTHDERVLSTVEG